MGGRDNLEPLPPTSWTSETKTNLKAKAPS
jgi:hypothetical protein